MRSVLLLTSILVASAPAGAGPPAAPELVARIDAYVAPFVAAGHLSGSLLVARGDEIVFEKSWGMANLEHGVPNTHQTKFCVASINKPMTIALVCKLVEQERMDPGDSIARWLPDFPRAEQITVSHLLNHRAGIPHRVTDRESETQPYTAADMVALVARTEFLPHAPGEKHHYSSATYSVLARVIELASGMTYPQALKKLLLEPVGMTHTGHADHRTLVPGRATAYFLAAEGPVNAPLQDLSFLVGAGAAHSTPRDLHRLMRAVVEGTLGEIVTAALLKEEGIRWNGITSGFRAFADYDTATDVSVVFTGNLLTGATDYLRRDIPRLVRGEKVQPIEPPEFQPTLVTQEVLRKYEGEYEDRRGRKLTARLRHGHLHMSQWPLIPTSKTTFFSPQDYGRVTVVFDDTGSVERLDWDRIEGVWPWTRIGDASPVD